VTVGCILVVSAFAKVLLNQLVVFGCQHTKLLYVIGVLNPNIKNRHTNAQTRKK
jgi:hypothetical protein